MSEADLAEFLTRARTAQRLINEAVSRVTPPTPQAIGANTRRERGLQNQDAHGRLLTVLVRDLKRHRRVAWIVRMNTGGFLSPDGKQDVTLTYDSPDIMR